MIVIKEEEPAMPSNTVFDGYTVTLYRAVETVVGSWAAISGDRGHQKPSEQFQSTS